MDLETKKQLLQSIPHALYVITSKNGGNVAASTISWVSQASFEPPLVTVALKRDSFTYRAVSASGAFVLNLLAEGQKDLAQKFFRHSETNDSTIAGVPFEKSQTLGYPIFPVMSGFLECRVLEKVEKGDHVVVVAEVISAEPGEGDGILLLSDTGWQYGG